MHLNGVLSVKIINESFVSVSLCNHYSFTRVLDTNVTGKLKMASHCSSQNRNILALGTDLFDCLTTM